MPPKPKKGLEQFEGERVELWCSDCIYKGVLENADKKDAELKEAMYSRDKGPKPTWEDLPNEHWIIRVSSIESYGLAS